MVALLPAINTPVFSAEDEANRLLGRGINLGNALEAPQEGAWGVTSIKLYRVASWPLSMCTIMLK